MTLRDFRRATAAMPPDTLIGYLSQWGQLSPAAIADRDECSEDDPVRDLLTRDIIVITTAEPEL
jgi:hypothetical protein